MMTVSKSKLIALCIGGVAALAQSCALTPYSETTIDESTENTTVSASIEETEDRLRVFIGDINRVPEDYLYQRSEFIRKTVESDAGKVMTAVIGLNDYYTANSVDSWMGDYDISIDRVYMWPKGETGRMMLNVKENNIESSLEGYKQLVLEDGYCEDEDFAKDLQRIENGEYKVFALTVTASAETLEALDTEAEWISYVDVMYNEEAEAYAQKVGKTVSYIELPSKPDGVH